MRIVIISLLLDCLLLFGIGYLAFGNTETISKLEMNTNEPFRQFVDTEIRSENRLVINR